VTRHEGLVKWLAQRGITGTVIDMDGLPVHLRGVDLTPAQMDGAGAQMRTYVVKAVEK